MNDGEQWYRWKVCYRNADDSGTGWIWLSCRNGDEAFDELDEWREGVKFITAVEKHKDPENLWRQPSSSF